MDEDQYEPGHRGAAQPPPTFLVDLDLDESLIAMYVSVALPTAGLTLQSYLQLIHPVLPILPATSTAVRAYLNGLGLVTRKAIVAALQCALSAARLTGDHASRAQSLYMESCNDGENLAQAQALLLLAIEANNKGILKFNIRPESGELLDMAVKIAERLEVHILPQNDVVDSSKLLERRKAGDFTSGDLTYSDVFRFSPNIAVAIPLAMMHVMEQLSRRNDANELYLFDVPLHLAEMGQLGRQTYWMSSTSNNFNPDAC
jgi:hypothetical protein